MQCPKCSKQVIKDSKFCIYCGEKIGSVKQNKKRELFDITKKIVKHLEFYGYKVGEIKLEEQTDKFLSIHNDKSNLLITVHSRFGITVVVFFSINEDKLAKNKQDFYKLINTMNLKAILSSFSLDADNNSLICSSWFPYHYSKELFANFLDVFEKDIRRSLTHEGMNKFT